MMTSKFPASLRVIGRAFVDWWDGWLDMVLVIVVWMVAQVTIIFGPPATFGLYYVAHQMINGEALGVKGLVAGARKYFGKAWAWGALNILAAIMIYVNVYFYGNIETAWGPYLFALIIMIAVLWYCTQFYALPYFMEQEAKNVLISMRNGILTTLASPFFTLIVMVVVVVIIGASLAFVLPIFLGLPGVVPFLGFRAMTSRLEAFGLRQPEKTPREIEMEESSQLTTPNLIRPEGDGSFSEEIADSEGDVQKSK